MRSIRWITVAMIVVLGLSVEGCVVPPSASNTGYLGRLEADGANGYLNGRHFKQGTLVYSGAQVTTGANTSIKIHLRKGGVIQLDENTDPLLEEGECLLIKVFTGRVFFNSDATTCIDTADLSTTLNTVANLTASGQGSVFTLIRGHAVVRRPIQAALAPGQQVWAAHGAAQIRQLLPQEAVATTLWVQRYFRNPVVPPVEPPPPRVVPPPPRQRIVPPPPPPSPPTLIQ
ncbi:hypothetical protein [Burkholderia ubonensis]|uniref:hypothetical protein n=1 Tax=Burkholderia ubonensis TaxID=101571 RepID=UPI000B329BD1|nr:hypothetical protein [Burkholderia ubonensis]